MLDHETVERFLLHSGYMEPSLVAMRPKYDRIIRRMSERGYVALNSDMAVTELTLIIAQMRRPEVRATPAAAAVEHNLRNITGSRRGGQWKT